MDGVSTERDRDSGRCSPLRLLRCASLVIRILDAPAAAIVAHQGEIAGVAVLVADLHRLETLLGAVPRQRGRRGQRQLFQCGVGTALGLLLLGLRFFPQRRTIVAPSAV